MTFQAYNFKGKHFLESLDNDYLPIKSVYIKNSAWLKSIGHSNFLCARVTRAITNHVPTGEYYLRFFPKENFSCSCSHYLIKSRHYILHEYGRYNKYWNPNREFFNHFIVFLEFNPSVFFFMKESLNSIFLLLVCCSLVSTYSFYSFCFFLPFSLPLFSLSSLYK